MVSHDEGLRPETTAETLLKLKPAFREGGTVTAGNASTLSDGAAALLVGSPAPPSGWRRRRWALVAYTTSGVAPKDIFIAPVLAVRRVLEKAEWTPGDVDLYELNEAFAAQMLACGKELRLDEEKVNVHGGAVALGHPIGRWGAVLTTLLYALERHGLRAAWRCCAWAAATRWRWRWRGRNGGSTQMPAPPGDLSPQELADRIHEWAAGHGYITSQAPHATEFAK